MSDPVSRGVKTLAIRLQDDLHTQLVVLAQLEEKSLTDVIREALEGHLERKRSESGVSDRAQAVLDEIEREAAARRGAIQALFARSPEAATPEAPADEPASKTKPGRRGSGSEGS